MKKDPMSLGMAIALLVVGILLGSVFSFGMQHWNKEVTREECVKIQTQFLGYKEDLRRGHIQQIIIDCANGNRYVIDGVSVNSKLLGYISKISPNENITLLIHPNSDTIVEFSTRYDTILMFSETIDKLGGEATGFLFLGAFMYFCSLIGLYYVVWHNIKNGSAKK